MNHLNKIIIFVACILSLYGCVFTFDPASGLLKVHNNSNEGVYVYHEFGKVDTMPLFSNTEILAFIDSQKEDAFAISGTSKNPTLPKNVNEVTFFFIAENTMNNYDLKEIYKNQLFTKKTIYSKYELEQKNWIITYTK